MSSPPSPRTQVSGTLAFHHIHQTTAIRIGLAGVLIFFLAIAAQADPVDDLIERGDAHAQRYEEENALSLYLAAEKARPNDSRLLVAIAREYRHQMSDATTDEAKLRFGQVALAYSKRAAIAGRNQSDAQLAPAITYGKLLPLLGRKEQLAASKEIRAAVDKALKLDPKNDLAWHVLGRWNLGFADVGAMGRTLGSLVYGKIPKTSYEEAAKCFRVAIDLKPDRLMHHIQLGRAYSEMGRTAEAAQLIKRGLTMRDTEKDDPETKKQGRAILAAL